MELKTLLDRLKDSDPWVRVEALRILAMVEETRALSAIEWVFKNDPEPGVRQVAQWAGRLVWEEQVRQQKAPKAMVESRPAQSRQEIEEELFLARLLVDQDNPALTSAMQVQALQYEMNRTMLEAKNSAPPQKEPDQTKANDNLTDLLAAGLSDDLRDP